MHPIVFHLRLILLAVIASLAALAQPLSVAARDAFNVGVREFQAGQYQSAAKSFQKAVERAPTLLTARVYLATALVHAYVPDDTSTENAEVGKAALAACQEVLNRDAANVPATDSMATIYFQMREFVRAREWNLKVLALDPGSKSSLYMLGAIYLSEVGNVIRDARNSLGMTTADPGPLRDLELREQLRVKHLKNINDGIEFERACLALDGEYARAMITLADLLRVRADLGDASAYASDMTEVADLLTRAEKAVAAGK